MRKFKAVPHVWGFETLPINYETNLVLASGKDLDFLYQFLFSIHPRLNLSLAILHVGHFYDVWKKREREL